MDRRRLSGKLRRSQRDRHRMAGEGRNLAARGGRGDTVRVRRFRARSRAHVEFSRGAEVPRAARAPLRGIARFFLSALLALVALPLAAGETIVASRVWPAQDYTRVTLESARTLRYQHFFVKDPERLVVDLEGVDLNDELKGLPTKVGADDPYIQSVRVGRNRPNVVRIVFDLKTEVKPSVFPAAPAGEYKHRLVLDIYPLRPPDPLLALLRPDPIREMAQAPMQERAAEAAAVEVPPLPVVKLDPERKEPEKRAAKIAQKPAPITKDRLVIVAIDAGHGGEDPGAKGRLGTREKDVTLAIAKRLKVLTDKEPNLRAVLVRDGDFFIPLAQRVSKSRRMQADILVSIHADAWVRPDARGSSVFALSERGATTAAARWLAQRENESDTIGGVNLGAKDPVLARTLLDLSLTATINDSLKLRRAVLSELGDVNTLHKNSVEQAGFAVLKAPDIPSILVETAVISNPDEEARLKDANYQDKIAAAILR